VRGRGAPERGRGCQEVRGEERSKGAGLGDERRGARGGGRGESRGARWGGEEVKGEARVGSLCRPAAAIFSPRGSGSSPRGVLGKKETFRCMQLQGPWLGLESGNPQKLQTKHQWQT